MGHISQEAVKKLPEAATSVPNINKQANLTPYNTYRLSKATQQISRNSQHEEPAEGHFNKISYNLMQLNEAYNGDK